MDYMVIHPRLCRASTDLPNGCCRLDQLSPIEVTHSRDKLYRVAALVPGLNVQTQAEWDAYVDGVGEVAALV
jgi:hypothetical protein